MTENCLKDKRVLITCGPTWVPIDDMRVISNRSTGSLGHILAQKLLKESARVTLLEGPVTSSLKVKGVKVKKFHFYDELTELLESEAKNKDIIIHAAAVSDYKLKKERSVKISSKLKKLTLDLIPTEKLIDKIKTYNKKAILIGFKLETKVTPNNIKKLTNALFDKAACDFVIANSSHDKNYNAYLINNKRSIIAQAASRSTIINKLIKTLKQ